MQNSENIQSNNIFFNILTSTMNHIEFLKQQPAYFSEFSSNLIKNVIEYKEEISKMKSNQTNVMLLHSQLDPKTVKNEEIVYKQSIKHLKVNENACMVQKTYENGVIEAETRLINDQPIYMNLNEIKKDSFSQKLNLNGSFEGMTIDENKKIQRKNSNPFVIIHENDDKTAEIEDIKPKKSANFPKMSFSSTKHRLSINLSHRLSQIKVDPEKEKRKSQNFDRLLAEKSLDELLPISKPKKSLEKIPENPLNNKKNNNSFLENDEFFSLEHDDDDMLNEMIQGQTIENQYNQLTQNNIKNPTNTYQFDKNMEFCDDSSKRINQLNSNEDKSDRTSENNYDLTNYSSNESSNNGSYFYQWKEVPVSTKKSQQNCYNNENSMNSMNYNYNSQIPNYNTNTNMFSFQNNNNNNMNSNNLYFSQKTAMFGIFDNTNLSNYNSKCLNFINSQPVNPFTSIAFDNNLIKNEKRLSMLLISPKKNKKKPKKLFCNAKIVPAWASDMNQVKSKMIEQKNLNPNNVFGEFIVENLDLGMLLNTDPEIFTLNRGSSANWKNDQPTPDSNLIKNASSKKNLDHSCSRSYKKVLNMSLNNFTTTTTYF